MNNQTVTYSEVNLAMNPKRQQIKPKDPDSSISVTEQEITYVELNLHGASQDLQKNDKNFRCKGKLIAGILGITSIVLMAGVITMKFKVISSSIGNPEKNRTPNASHCGRCPEDWLSYSNSCYYVSSDKKTWTESQMACASKKSNLTNIDNEEEMKFMDLLPYSWVGLSRESSNYPWLWINGSPSNQKIREIPNRTYNCAIVYSSSLQSASCGSAKTYICKLETLS
ncbi:NKG2-A/NKG2-B type II integral membrane protein-like isoform X1 [Elephas maximus indicus]|uniref:NKG2-A/NKG2-B type II integral membrane protein-like isoform X1 n=1 Tax=Elephas maximus indicus TaxID=99487 RepID=UPI002115E5BE|nr:NKG2-A/NKG2-B type II integral membrane protein-like isoform X1 [Elephas maximus indicus]